MTEIPKGKEVISEGEGSKAASVGHYWWWWAAGWPG